jgi:hypothetical protein
MNRLTPIDAANLLEDGCLRDFHWVRGKSTHESSADRL